MQKEISDNSFDYYLLHREVPMIESNFLCIHKKFRLKRLTPILIVELYRRVNLNGIFQGVNTAGVLLPGAVSKCLYVYYSL
jgi:glycylpeptide N-tetradecanoyltransferase